MHVETGEVDSLAMEFQGWERGQVAAAVQRVGWPESPVEEIALDGAVVVDERWLVRGSQAIAGEDIDGGLLGASAAGCVLCSQVSICVHEAV